MINLPEMVLLKADQSLAEGQHGSVGACSTNQQSFLGRDSYAAAILTHLQDAVAEPEDEGTAAAGASRLAPREIRESLESIVWVGLTAHKLGGREVRTPAVESRELI